MTVWVAAKACEVTVKLRTEATIVRKSCAIMWTNHTGGIDALGQALAVGARVVGGSTGAGCTCIGPGAGADGTRL